MASSHNEEPVDLVTGILHALSQKNPILSAETFSTHSSADLKSALDRLASRSMITYETIDNEIQILEPEAEGIVKNGSHEARVFEALRQALEGLTVAELETAIGDANVAKMGPGKAMKAKWIERTKDGRFKALVSSVRAAAGSYILIHIGEFHTRYHSGAIDNYPRDAVPPRSKGRHRLEKAKAYQDAEGHTFQDKERAQVRLENGQGGDGFNAGAYRNVGLDILARSYSH